MGDSTLSGNFYYQLGKDRGDNDLLAYEAAFDVGFKASDNLSLFAEYEALSGAAYDET